MVKQIPESLDFTGFNGILSTNNYYLKKRRTYL